MIPGLQPTIPRHRLSLEYRAQYSATNDASTYTFSNADIGAAASDRLVIVAVHAAFSGGTNRTITSATIGGISATIDYAGTNTDARGFTFLSAIVPTGTTATIVLNFSGNLLRLGIGVYRLTKYTSRVPRDTASSFRDDNANNISDTINVYGGGVVIGMSFSGDDANGGNVTWSGLTENYDGTIESSLFYYSGAHQLIPTHTLGYTVSVTCAVSPDMMCIVLASWW